MKANGVKVNDIYESSKGTHLEFGKGNDDVHFKPKGYEAIGQHISDFLKKAV